MRSAVSLLAPALLLALCVAPSAPAGAEPGSKVNKDSGRFVEYDAGGGTVTIRVKGKNTLFHVKAEGSVLTRTTVSLNAAPGKLTEIPADAPVIVYWMPCDAGGANCPKPERRERYARKIDAPKVPKELMDAIDD